MEEYINNVLDEKRPEFGGKRVCPFAAHELSSNKLMIAELGDKSLIDLISEFKNSGCESALFVIKENIPADETKDFQMFVNRMRIFSILLLQLMKLICQHVVEIIFQSPNHLR